jgi:hypothetical protein
MATIDDGCAKLAAGQPRRLRNEAIAPHNAAAREASGIAEVINRDSRRRVAWLTPATHDLNIPRYLSPQTAPCCPGGPGYAVFTVIVAEPGRRDRRRR